MESLMSFIFYVCVFHHSSVLLQKKQENCVLKIITTIFNHDVPRSSLPHRLGGFFFLFSWLHSNDGPRIELLDRPSLFLFISSNIFIVLLINNASISKILFIIIVFRTCNSQYEPRPRTNSN